MKGNTEVGLGTALTVVFTVLKLTGVIEWSWIWVLSPVWIIALIDIGVIIIGIVILKVMESRTRTKRERSARIK